MYRLCLLLALLMIPFMPSRPASALTCNTLEHDGSRYTICRVDMAQDDLRLFLNDTSGKPFGQFSQVDAALRTQGERLAFAMNAGMYHNDRAPVGHYVEGGSEVMRVIPNAGPGNFGLLPNGILCIRPGRADVIETLRYVDEAPACTFATQSGPMLVIDGKLHPRFLVDSTSRYIRNGVGTSTDGQTAIFAISEQPVTFHQFGRLFRDVLKLPQALFLDGNISRLYAPDLGRSDIGRWMGPIVGVVTPTE
ncbi:phosphodiester glycosidase family protein [Puniceibacterium sp. IMCC21224]|uniref:phosphodiester glycosidase family protein n=1 Tax=Puniceibacterium sp. IMCC21224 TaxID=1618204 RepID=UPI00064D72EC|nr:phosphodiester glycosidase family protein [Puniceibacterium sp. IMCC21224]KMK68682.1 putative periplasmic protein [Puniceibacterium sp. IMCC21224]